MARQHPLAQRGLRDGLANQQHGRRQRERLVRKMQGLPEEPEIQFQPFMGMNPRQLGRSEQLEEYIKFFNGGGYGYNVNRVSQRYHPDYTSNPCAELMEDSNPIIDMEMSFVDYASRLHDQFGSDIHVSHITGKRGNSMARKSQRGFEVGDLVIVAFDKDKYPLRKSIGGIDVRPYHHRDHGKIATILSVNSVNEFVRVTGLFDGNHVRDDMIEHARDVSEDTLFDMLVSGKLNDETYSKAIKQVNKK